MKDVMGPWPPACFCQKLNLGQSCSGLMLRPLQWDGGVLSWSCLGKTAQGSRDRKVLRSKRALGMVHETIANLFCSPAPLSSVPTLPNHQEDLGRTLSPQPNRVVSQQ